MENAEAGSLRRSSVFDVSDLGELPAKCSCQSDKTGANHTQCSGLRYRCLECDITARQTGSIFFAAVIEIVVARIQRVGADLQPEIRIAKQVRNVWAHVVHLEQGLK